MEEARDPRRGGEPRGAGHDQQVFRSDAAPDRRLAGGPAIPAGDCRAVEGVGRSIRSPSPGPSPCRGRGVSDSSRRNFLSPKPSTRAILGVRCPFLVRRRYGDSRGGDREALPRLGRGRAARRRPGHGADGDRGRRVLDARRGRPERARGGGHPHGRLFRELCARPGLRAPGSRHFRRPRLRAGDGGQPGHSARRRSCHGDPPARLFRPLPGSRRRLAVCPGHDEQATGGRIIPPMDRFARYSWITLACNIAVVLWGAAVRATGSGAGCGSHWPLCNGEIVPRSPRLETIIELTHRVTSGIALLLVVGLVVLAFRWRPRGHAARKAAAFTLFFMLTEAAVGAGLVLFELVADNQSMARALFMGTHLTNTFFLLGAMALTAHFASGGAPFRLRGRGSLAVWLVSGAALLLIAGVSGAITALGDTLFPAGSLTVAQ